MATAKQQFLDTYKMEHAITMKVLRAFPADEHHFKPHDVSRTAKELAHTFVVEEQMLAAGLQKKLTMPPSFPSAPESWHDTIAAFDTGYHHTLAAINSADADLSGMVPFFTGPGKMGDVPLAQFAWMMLCDQIHHRGQFSVYVRMAGGKVPSIYGPSHDEPWR